MEGFISSSPILIQKSLLLLKYKSGDDVKMTYKEISGFYGDMRYYVMMKNSRLYTENRGLP